MRHRNTPPAARRSGLKPGPLRAADVVSDRVYKDGNKQETHVRAGAER